MYAFRSLRTCSQCHSLVLKLNWNNNAWCMPTYKTKFHIVYICTHYVIKCVGYNSIYNIKGSYGKFERVPVVSNLWVQGAFLSVRRHQSLGFRAPGSWQVQWRVSLHPPDIVTLINYSIYLRPYETTALFTMFSVYICMYTIRK